MQTTASRFIRTGFSVLALTATTLHAQSDLAAVADERAWPLEVRSDAAARRILDVDELLGGASGRRPDVVVQDKEEAWTDRWLLSLNTYWFGSAAISTPVFKRQSPIAPHAAPTVLTSGTLSTLTSANYSTAPWMITTGDGTYPDLGGVASFIDPVATTPGTFPTAPTITLDVAVTLSGLSFDTVYAHTLAAGAGSLSLTSTGTNTIDAPTSAFSTPTTFPTGHIITAPIGGGGAFGLTKTGAGTVTLAATNTYTGGTFINGGVLRITTGDAALGSTAAGNDVSINGGTLRISTTALATARNFTLGTNGATLGMLAAATINGVVSGPGSLTLANSSGGLTLTAVDTYAGATTTLVGNTLTLSGNGSILNTSGLDLTGSLSLNNSVTNVADRVADTTPITMRGGFLVLTAIAGAATTETLGAVTLGGGATFITATPTTTSADTLTLASLTRQNNATAHVSGTSLGAASAVNVGQIKLGTAPTLVGGGGAAGTSTISIVPWLTGNLASNTVGASSFVTYSATTGLRPLATTEYTTLASATSTSNVRATAATTVSASTTVNSFVTTSTAATALTTTNSSVLTITSGALLYSPSASTSTIISANLNFGTAEGVISTSAINTTTPTSFTLTLSGILAGSGGLTLNPFAISILSSTPTFSVTGTANTYTGTTTLLSGTVAFTGSLPKDGTTASAFGKDTSAIVINTNSVGTRLWANTAGAVIARDLTVTGSGAGTVGLGTVADTALTMNGNIALGRPLTLEGGSTPATALTINGNISGTGYLTDNFGSYSVLNGTNNTYSGGTLITTGTYVAGSDTAFGTGTISAAGAGFVLGAGTTARTFANPLQFNNGTTAFTFAGTAPLTFTSQANLNGTTSLAFTNTGGTTISGRVLNGALTKSGAGTLTLSRANGNSYAGGTVVSAGSLLVTNTSGSGTGPGAISVTGTGSLLGGTGYIVNTVPAGSTAATTSIATGAIIQGGLGGNTGALTLTGNLSLVSGSIIELGLGADGTNSALVRGGGLWVLSNGIKFTFTGSPTIGQTYDNLIAGLAGDPGTEGTWTVTNNGFSGTFVYDGAGGIDLTMTTVPEPATVLGGALTVALLGRGMWRRRKQAALVG